MRHLPPSQRPRRSSRAAAAVAAVAAVAAALVWATPAGAQSSEAASVGNRAQTAFLRDDAAALDRIESSVRAWAKSPDSFKLYAYAFVQFRKSQMAREARRDEQAMAAGQACIAALDAALEASARFADAYTLRSACQVYVGSYSMFNWYRYGSEADDGLEMANRFGRGNPRAVLVEGLRLWFGPVFVGDQDKACDVFLQAAKGFGDQPESSITRDSVGIRWGAAEANFWMGRCSRNTGDREVEFQYYDRALRFAPDFAAVQRVVR
jgi:tetratricopeptide (TPR) repeat protein